MTSEKYNDVAMIAQIYIDQLICAYITLLIYLVKEQ